MFRKLLALTLCLLLAVSSVSAAPAQQASAAPAAVESTAEMSLFPKVNTFSGFSDTGTHWALPYIRTCYEAGLMLGVGNNAFAPDAPITNSEVTALAARIHAALHGETIYVGKDKAVIWYQWYIDYLTGFGISSPPPRAYATRQGFFELLAAVLPDTALAPINAIVALPDTTDPVVLKFYNAGILTGVDRFGTFAGGSPLTRGECATMVARVVEPSLRRQFTPDGQVPASPFPHDAVVLTVNGTPIPFDRFSDVLLSMIEETQQLYLDYGLVFDWEGNYGSENWSWCDFFKSATVHSVSAEVIAAAKAAELGCPVEELALTLFGPPTQAELDAYAAEHDMTITSPNANQLLAELILEEKLNTQLALWVEEAERVTTPVYGQLDPRELWEIFG